jgi:DNA-binding transcriptional LysR family regulator
VTRAIALLEQRTGARLLQRTTRSVKLTEAGERYLVACRRIVAELHEAEAAAGERSTPRGLLTITAPVTFGRIHVRPIVDAFLASWPDVEVRFHLFDRMVNLVDEGIDLAIRIGHLADTGQVAIKVGEVTRVACASPRYLARRKAPREPSELASHDCVMFSEVTTSESWTFASPDAGRAKHVKVRPRLTVNGADAAIASAVEGGGVTCVLSYQVESELRDGRLVRVLAAFEPDPIPVHVLYPSTTFLPAKTRAFVDVAVPALKTALARVASLPFRAKPKRMDKR